MGKKKKSGNFINMHICVVKIFLRCYGQLFCNKELTFWEIFGSPLNISDHKSILSVLLCKGGGILTTASGKQSDTDSSGSGMRQ